MGFGVLTSLPLKKSTKSKSKILSKTKAAQSAPNSQKRRPLEDEIIYGEELFASSRRKEKEIVVCFLPFSKNNMRLSKDGKFIIQYAQLDADEEENEIFFSLYYLQSPLKHPEIVGFDVDSIKKAIIIPSSDSCLIEKTPHLNKIEERIIESIKLEYFNERKQKLEDLKLAEIEAKAAKDLQEAQEDLENEKLAKESKNELVANGKTEFSANIDSEINNETFNQQEATTILQEAQQENDIKADNSTKERKTRGFSFREI